MKKMLLTLCLVTGLGFGAQAQKINSVDMG